MYNLQKAENLNHLRHKSCWRRYCLFLSWHIV